MNSHPLAGKPAPQSILTNIPRLVSNYYSLFPDPAIAGHRVAFGTSTRSMLASGHLRLTLLIVFFRRFLTGIFFVIPDKTFRGAN